MPTRFKVDVGVAYGSDTQLVKQILIDAALANPDVIKDPPPSVLFQDFGNSSLDFSVYFFSDNLFWINRTRSDIRFAIDEAFRKNGVTIPFPQRDLWIKQGPPERTANPSSKDEPGP